MTEKRFLNLVLLEGILITILGLCILILPKLTSLTFGVILSASFIAYGLFKIISSFINKHYTSNILWSLLNGAFILTIGILLLFVPKISLLWLIALIGIFFLLESVSSIVFISKVRTIFNSIVCKSFAALILYLTGVIIILGLPVMSFWLVALLSGLALLIKGMAKITIACANKNNYSV